MQFSFCESSCCNHKKIWFKFYISVEIESALLSYDFCKKKKFLYLSFVDIYFTVCQTQNVVNHTIRLWTIIPPTYWNSIIQPHRIAMVPGI